jgi:hypothetical protein
MMMMNIGAQTLGYTLQLDADVTAVSSVPFECHHTTQAFPHVCCVLQDDTVPVATSQQLFAQFPASDMALTLVKDGDHRLSRPHDLQLLLSTVNDLIHHATG